MAACQDIKHVVLPDTNGQFKLSQYEISQFPLPAIPSTDQHMPRQEPGRRPQIP